MDNTCVVIVAEMSGLPPILGLSEVGEHRYAVTHPDEPPEGRDVVFSGLLMGQMLMASDRESAGTKEVRSIHAIFARAGVYTKPLELSVDSMQAGRTWGSDTITATQDGKLLSRALVLLNTIDDDLIRHGPECPADVPAAEELAPAVGQVFPAVDWRPVPKEMTVGGVPVTMGWHRLPLALPSTAAHQAVLTWATCGNVIAAAMSPHTDKVDVRDAHRSLSTGVIAHTVHFVDSFDTTDWLLIVSAGTSAGRGRVYGEGSVFTRDGTLVATFQQDSMVKAAGNALNPARSL